MKGGERWKAGGTGLLHRVAVSFPVEWIALSCVWLHIEVLVRLGAMVVTFLFPCAQPKDTCVAEEGGTEAT